MRYFIEEQVTHLFLVRNRRSEPSSAALWIALCPRGMMSPSETWVVGASDPRLNKREVL
jgi:hypothetical protein